MEIEALEEFGLNKREAIIYLMLLREKSCTASKLAKLSKMNRTTAYLELENLMKLGLVSYVVRNSKRYYQPSPPEKFIQILDSKKDLISSILPNLNNLSKGVDKAKIEVFEGKEGIKTFYQDIYNNCKEFFVIGATGKATEVLEFSYPHFLKSFVKAGIREKAIANYDSKSIMEKHPKPFIKVKYFPKKYDSEVTTVIYNGKVAFQSLEQENIYVVVITDAALYHTYKNHFNFIWGFL